MKKTRIIAITIATVMMMVMTTSVAWAGPLSGLVPKVDGDDVLVPDMVVEAIPGYDSEKPVYAAHDINGWLLSDVPDQIMEATEMVKTENGWVAKGMKGEIFHPAQIGEDGQPKWAKLERVYRNLDEFDFIDRSGTGPSIKIE